MLLDQDMAEFLWGEATMTTIYIQNRIPHITLNKMTLEEAFIGIVNHQRDHHWLQYLLKAI